MDDSTLANLRVTSTWVDQYPKARDPKDSASRWVELADLLLVVNITFNGLSRYKSALLVQAKCAACVNQLDACQRLSSSWKERNLLEMSSGTLEVRTSSGGDLLNPTKSSYILAAPSVPAIGLEKFARYLIIPNNKIQGLPYNLLWPSSRTATGGSVVHLGQAMLGMAKRSAGAVGQACTSPSTGGVCGDDWSQLVHDIIFRYSHASPLARFPSAVKPISRSISSKLYSFESSSLWNRFLDAFARAVFTAPSYMSPPVDEDAGDEGEGGFMILEVWLDQSE
ncbi:hypothetical protein [Luteimonas terrae]|uniref:Uncharacterized protein n=1 Tax=Luteimonas terrae TaxID=1530191 RepID=A0ABU1XW00_9GAMM|nr:hypothetical protein [Luteimonas terrae]MDR7192930.1 hypothetical protein [Luteimonas terrae]